MTRYGDSVTAMSRDEIEWQVVGSLMSIGTLLKYRMIYCQMLDGLSTSEIDRLTSARSRDRTMLEIMENRECRVMKNTTRREYNTL
jgi:hypothetical protein